MMLATIGQAVGAMSRKQNAAVGAARRSTAACRPYSAAKRQLAILFPALLAATLALACTSDDEPPRTDGFYAEVAIEVEPAPDDPIARFGIAEGRSVIRWWYAPDPVRWRWEIETVGTIIDDGVVLTVVNGDDSWAYDDRTNTYRRGIIGGIPAGVVPPRPSAHPSAPPMLRPSTRSSSSGASVATLRSAWPARPRCSVVARRSSNSDPLPAALSVCS